MKRLEQNKKEVTKQSVSQPVHILARMPKKLTAQSRKLKKKQLHQGG